MTTTENTAAGSTGDTGTALITQNMIEQFLYREARYLDDREFERWLECYADDVVYWMPCWDDHDTLTQDPQRASWPGCPARSPDRDAVRRALPPGPDRRHGRCGHDRATFAGCAVDVHRV